MLFAELKYRKKRVITTMGSFVVGILLLLIINSLALGFQILAGKPMEKIGCNITVQKSGNIPEKMVGAVLPCAAVTIKKAKIEQISTLESIETFSKAVLLWMFEKDTFYSVLGIEPNNPIGPGLLKNCIVEGRFVRPEGLEAVIEKSIAQSYQLKSGDTLVLATNIFTIVGIVDATQLGKMISAQVYIPFAEAAKIASASEGVKKIAPFSSGDATILFMNVKQSDLEATDRAIKKIIGKKASVSSPITILKKFKGIIMIFTAFSNLLVGIVVLVSIVIISLSIGQSANLRKHEFAIFKAVGWKPSEIMKFITMETVALSFVSALIGVVLSYAIIHLFGFLSIDVTIPWETNASTPHFLQDSPNETMTMKINFPVIISIRWIFYAIVGSCTIGMVTGYLTARKVNQIKPLEAVKNG